MPKRLLQALMIGLGAASLGLYCVKSSAAKGRAIRLDRRGSATLKGVVLRGGEDRYLVEAKAGQSLQVTIQSLGANAVFEIRPPGGTGRCLPGADAAGGAVSWQGVLPQSGAYVIVVGSSRGSAEYVLKVERGV